MASRRRGRSRVDMVLSTRGPERSARSSFGTVVTSTSSYDWLLGQVAGEFVITAVSRHG